MFDYEDKKRLESEDGQERPRTDDRNGQGHEDSPQVNWTTPNDDFGRRSYEERRDYAPRYDYGDRGHYNGNGRKGQGSSGKRWIKKTAGICAAAVLFGAVAGGVMTGVNAVGNSFLANNETEETVIAKTETKAAPETVPETAPERETPRIGESAPAQAPSTASADVSAIVEEAMPSIVAINDTMTVQQTDLFGFPKTYTAESSGSGIIIGQNETELLVATNNHVVDNAQDLKVTFVDGKDAQAAVKGTDSATDLAIVAVALSDISEDTKGAIKIASIGSSDDLKVGQQVIAIGNALGYGQSVTVGYVSALGREITDEDGISRTFIQTDAAINPGNSGGALLDSEGRLIGINAAKTASTEVEGIGFAIPISNAEGILNTLMTKKTRVEVAEEDQGWLGIQGTNIDASAAAEFDMPIGVYVYKIVEGGAASASDLHEKDIITKFDGQSITNMEGLKQMLTYYESGTEVVLTVQSLSDGAYIEREVSLTLGSRPATAQ